MNKKLLLLPVDGRPVVHKQLELLGELAGWNIIIPPISILGRFREAADHEEIDRWIEENSGAVDAYVLSLDTLIYGGLVASRICTDCENDLLQRPLILKSLKANYAKKPIYAFLSTMRISNNNLNDEEKLYWSRYGELIWAWSYHADRYQVHGHQADLEASELAKNKIPEHIRMDYMETRNRNHKITQTILDYVADNTIERLILPQDDNATYGFTVAETRRLKEIVSSRGLDQRVHIYSGADEVAWTLITTLISDAEQRNPRKIYIEWHFPDDAAQLIPRYEDTAIGTAVQNQIISAGAMVSESITESDIVLAVHTGNGAQGDWALNKPIETERSSAISWVQKLKSYQDCGRMIAIADLAYANGGDPCLFEVAFEFLDLDKIITFGGWNTTSNTLGSTAAQLQLTPMGKGKVSRAQKTLKLIRFVDDVFYQGQYRQILRADIQRNKIELEEATVKFRDAANEWIENHFSIAAYVENVYFPWGRSFEIGFDVTLSKQGLGKDDKDSICSAQI